MRSRRMWVFEMIAWIRHNLWYKVLSLCLSIVLWVYVVNTDNPITTLEVRAPVEARGVPDGLQTTAIEPSELRVVLQGRTKSLARLDGADSSVRLVANLANKTVGSYEVPLAPQGLPRGVEVIASQRLKATVDLEEVKSEKRQVVVAPVGFAASGFVCRWEAPQPGTAIIRGPRSAVASVRNVVARISVSDLDTTTNFHPPLQAVNAEGQRVTGVTVEPERVDVRVVVEPVPHRVLVVRPVFGDPPAGREIERFSVQPTTVVVSGPMELLDNLTAVPTALIDLTGVRRETTRSVSLAPPQGVAISGPDTATVTVFLRPLPRPPSAPEVEPPEPVEGPPGGEPAGGPERAPAEGERSPRPDAEN